MKRIEMTQAHFYDEFSSKVTNLNPLIILFSPYGKTVIVYLSNQNHVGRMCLRQLVTLLENGEAFFGKTLRECDLL